MRDIHHDHSCELDAQTKERLKQDFEISEQDEIRVNTLIEQLHNLCVKLELPMVVAVTVAKKKVIDEKRGTGERTNTVCSLHLNGGRVPNDVRAAAMILESDNDIPLHVIHLLTS